MRPSSLVGVFLIACAPAAAQQTPGGAGFSSTPPSQIAATASAETKVTPDRATIEIGVQTRASTAAQAASENARKQQAILDTLRAIGIANEQITTTNYSIFPEMQHSVGDREPRVIGFVASNSIRADLRRIDLVGRAIDAAVAKGSNTINSLQFYSSSIDDAHRRALADAVSKARADAEAMARAAGGSLGRLLELTSGRVQPPIPYPMMGMARMEAAQATPIQPGEQSVSAYVSARWEFVPSRP